MQLLHCHDCVLSHVGNCVRTKPDQIKPPMFMSMPMPRFCIIGMKGNIKSECITQAKAEVTNALNWSLQRMCSPELSVLLFLNKGHCCPSFHSKLNPTLLALLVTLSNSTVWAILPRAQGVNIAFICDTVRWVALKIPFPCKEEC